jgi:arylsulfatase A-like enzyme
VAPGFAPRIVREPVGLADVLPTVLELVGVRAPPALQGMSLAGAMRGGATTADAPRFSELDRGVRLRSVVRGDRHLIVDLDRRERFAFDLALDPWEERRLSKDAPGIAALAEALDEHLKRLPRPADVSVRELSPAERERLEALGYVR